MGRLTKREFKSLLEWRNATQTTQVDAAKHFGITQGAWSLLENGVNNASPKLAKRIASETGVPLVVLLGIADESSVESKCSDPTDGNC